MALFVEKRRGSGSSRIFPLAIIEGEALGMTIQVKSPEEFREFYPFVLSGYFEAVNKCAGKPRILSGETEEEVNDILDVIAGACRCG
jgi:hypothetical protein